jgi:DNA transposition AAA+ family ATPase
MTTTSAAPDDGKKPKIDITLQARLLHMRELPQWSNLKLAKKLNCNPAYVQGYISGDFPADVVAFEKKLRDFFDNEARRQASGIDTVDCNDTRQVKTAFEFIRKTNDIGAVVANSGDGKSRGIEHYVSNSPLTVVYKTAVWSADKGSVEANLFDQIGPNGWNRMTKRATHMVNVMRGSDRLIVVDDAHKLTRPALQWFFDFHDATQCPVALVGTFELLDKLEDDPQRFSRVGYRLEIRNLDDKGKLIVDRDLIKHLVTKLLPNVNGELEAMIDLCEQVASEHGHYRSVHKQLKLTAEIKAAAGKELTHIGAFRAAHTKLIRKYKLG